MAKQQYEMPAAEWRRLQPFYVLTVEALKNERDRAARRGGVKQVRENGEAHKWPSTFPTFRRNTRPRP